MKNKDFILYAIIASLAFLLLRGCNSDKVTPGAVTIVKTDTLREYLKGTSDTVFFSVEKIVYKTLPSTQISISPDSIKTFKTLIKDSLIEGVITSKLKGSLKNVSFSYVPKFPKYITRVDTFKQIVTNEIIKPRFSLSGGAVLGGNGVTFSVAPSVMLTTPKGTAISLGYDLLNKSYYIGAFVKIKRPSFLQ